MTSLQQILIFCQQVRYPLKFAQKKQICSFILTTTLQTLRWLRFLPEQSGRWHRICPARMSQDTLKSTTSPKSPPQTISFNILLPASLK